jgi:hypothetical protein
MVHVKQMFMYDAANCPNIKDPLFLIFRIHSANVKVYSKMGEAIQSVFGYGNASGNQLYKPSNAIPMDRDTVSSFHGKVTILVDVTGLTGFENSTLAPITALRLGTMTNQIYRESDAVDLLDSGIDPNRGHLNILYPDYNAKSNNYDFYTAGMKQRFQMIGMNFQMNDVYLTKYHEFFKSSIEKQPEPEPEL